ncbi:MAG: trypsin-like peptidase domain-containing protein [Acidobacteria bacterium]|nr:trypsin-like peptidase domain-containing protein [Acidobacteriota bacterium]
MTSFNGKKLAYFILVLGALMIGVGIGTIITYKASAHPGPVADKLKIQGSGDPLTLNKQFNLADGFASVAEAVGPAVVNISTTARVRARTPQQESPFGDDFWRWFFERGMPREQVLRSLGSGVIVDSKGFIITNHHVVGAADTISVKLADGREFPGIIVGSDPDTDIGVIRIKDDKPFPFAKVGNSEDSKAGDWVMAIGSPFGLDQSVTVGIISAKGRIAQTQSLFTDYIQTDAAINRGNSGGPLVNMRGEIIGINTFIQSPTGGNIGIGFSIPSGTIVNVYNQIVEYGKVSRGQIGIYMNTLPMTDALAEFFNVPAKGGVIVTGLTEQDSPAREAGIESEDVIVEFNGRTVDSPDTLRSLVAQTPPGTDCEVKIIRDGQPKTVTVTLGERPPLRATQPSGQPFDLDEEEQKQKPEIGFSVNDIPAAQLQRLGLATSNAILVEEVKPGSLAEEAGLETNDIIVEVDGKPVTTALAFVNKIRDMKSGESVVLKFIKISANSQATFFTSITKP